MAAPVCQWFNWLVIARSGVMFMCQINVLRSRQQDYSYHVHCRTRHLPTFNLTSCAKDNFGLWSGLAELFLKFRGQFYSIR